MPQWEISFRPQIDLTDREILQLLVYAEAHRQFANKIPVPPPIAEKLDRLNLVRQIKGTTGIEGNTLSETEIEDILLRGVQDRHGFPPCSARSSSVEPFSYSTPPESLSTFATLLLPEGNPYWLRKG